MTANELLIAGALITRVDRPAPAFYALSLGFPGGSACLALVGGPERPRPSVALLDERPRGAAADGEVRGLREKLEGGRIHGFGPAQGGAWELLVDRGALRYRVIVSARGLSVSAVQDHPSEPPAEAEGATKLGITSAAAFAAEHERALVERLRASALRAVERARGRVARRLAALGTDVAAMAEADERAAHATLFVGAARAAKAHARELVATDWSSGEAVEIRFPLRGDRPAHAEVEAVFHHAKRLRRGQAQADARRAEAATADQLLVAAAGRLEAVGDRAELEREIARLQRALPGDIRLELSRAQPATAKREEPPRRQSYRAFASATGCALLVGKGGADNDALTLHVARPHDHFFHAKDAKGAHVIAVAKNKGALLDPRVLLEGALLAAHFSDRRGEAVVDVQHCARRHVRKRKGAPPGLVELSQEKVIALRTDPAALARLLASEDRG